MVWGFGCLGTGSRVQGQGFRDAVRIFAFSAGEGLVVRGSGVVLICRGQGLGVRGGRGGLR